MAIRRRYYFWLFKAYLKRWKKTIITALILGFLTFFGLILLFNLYILPLFVNRYEKIGFAGAYTFDNLPPQVLNNVSYGLTKINSKGEVTPGIAQDWKVSENGKIYTFKLKPELKLNNGRNFDIKELPYEFKDVKKEIVNSDTVRFTLKEPYSPFLSVVSSPIIVRNSGFADFKITKVDQNSGFIKSVTLVSSANNKKKVYYFYPTEQALKTAYELGEVDSADNLTYISNIEVSFKNWKNTKIEKNVDYSSLVAIFFNTTNDTLANKKVRQALLYTLPPDFPQGKRAFSFTPPQSAYYSQSPNEGLLDLDLAKSLLESAGVTNLKITLVTTDEYMGVAKKVAESWKKLGFKTEIKSTIDIPSNFQAFLYVMKIPKDPDMYALWHSNQPNNISHYKNVRIDKLLEEGRQTTNQEERVRIYADIQKYLLDDAPAAFLYFPYTYTITRK